MSNKYKKHNSQVYDSTTGELLDLNDVKEVIVKDLLKHAETELKLLSDLGLVSGVKIVRDNGGEPYPVIPLKEGFEFNKILRGDVNFVFENSELSNDSFAFIGRFTACLHFPSNSILLNGIHPTQDELAKAMRVGRTTINKALKELEFYDVIKRVKVNGKIYIYFNPFLYSVGLISIDTYKIFRDSIHNPNKSSLSDSSNKKEYERIKTPSKARKIKGNKAI